MSKKKAAELRDYAGLLAQIKGRIEQAQTRAMLSVNAELVRLYWDVGRLIDDRQQKAGWGSSVIPRLSSDLRGQLSEIKGFSERNIDRMVAFYRAYPSPASFSPQPVAKSSIRPNLPQAVVKLASARTASQAAAPVVGPYIGRAAYNCYGRRWIAERGGWRLLPPP